MRVAIGSDHAGYELKSHLLGALAARGHEVVDLGTDSTESVDYPPICAAVARRVVAGDTDVGIVLGGSGQGEQIAANKVVGARAALCNDLYTARMARAHNDANVLAMGGRIVAAGLAEEILDVFLATAFEGGRHQRRVDQIHDIERGSHPIEIGRIDAGQTDAGQTDAGQTDAGQTDAGQTDAGQTDAGQTDAGPIGSTTRPRHGDLVGGT